MEKRQPRIMNSQETLAGLDSLQKLVNYPKEDQR